MIVTRLTAAVEELLEAVEVASPRSDVCALQHLASRLGPLGEVVERKLAAAVDGAGKTGTPQMANANHDIAALTNAMESVKSNMKNITRELERERNQKTLARALKLVHLDSFEYWDLDENTTTSAPGQAGFNSSELARSAIAWFLVGGWVHLPRATLDQDVACHMDKEGGPVILSREQCEAAEKAFREKFTAQISLLIGCRPRLEKLEDGAFALYYV